MLGRQKISQCTLALTRSCNLRCEFCFAKKAGYSANEFMSYANAKSVVDFCCDAKIGCIVFTGGEPTLYPNLLDLMRYVKSQKNKMYVALTTNGIAMKDLEYCKNLVAHGLDYVDISLKGNDRESFSKTTGCDDFHKQLQAMQNLSALLVDFTCSMVITADNVNSFCDGIQSAYDSGARKFSFSFIMDNEVCDEKNELYLERNNPFMLVESFLSQIDTLNSITKREWWIEFGFPTCVFTEKQLSLLEGKLGNPCQVHKQSGITFDTKMNLLPCVMNMETFIGRYGSDFSTYKEFKKYLKRDSHKRIVNTLKKLPSPSCRSCKYVKNCQGGCSFFWMNCSFEAFVKFKNAYFSSFNFTTSN